MESRYCLGAGGIGGSPKSVNEKPLLFTGFAGGIIRSGPLTVVPGVAVAAAEDTCPVTVDCPKAEIVSRSTNASFIIPSPMALQTPRSRPQSQSNCCKCLAL